MGEVWAEECPLIGADRPNRTEVGLRPGGGVAPRCPQWEAVVEGQLDTGQSKVGVKIVTHVGAKFQDCMKCA